MLFVASSLTVSKQVVPDLDTDAVAGPSRQLGEGGGLERDTEAEAGEESMDIDAECTSSQGRLALAANTSGESKPYIMSVSYTKIVTHLCIANVLTKQ